MESTKIERRYRVHLEVSPPEIFYYIEYDPPYRYCLGPIGWLLPGGTIGTFTYAQLCGMIQGTHQLVFDEEPTVVIGADEVSKEDMLFRNVRFNLFAERIIGGLPGRFYWILRAMTPHNAGRIIPLLSNKGIQELKEYAERIAVTRAERDEQKYHADPFTGDRVPDENLQVLLERFGKR